MSEPKSQIISAHNATGSVFVIGDNSHGSISTTTDARSINVANDIAELKALLLGLKGLDSKTAAAIDATLVPAEEEAKEKAPDKGYIGPALERAVKLSKGAADFAENAEKIEAKARPLIGWLGEYGPRLASLLGLGA